MPRIMNALILGGSGFLGSVIADRLVQRGDRVTVVSRGNRSVRPDTEHLAVDRRNAGALARALANRRFDLTVDCIGYQESDVDASLSALADRCGHYLFISTDFVYANDLERFPIDEDAPKDEVSPYAAGKLACERRLMCAWEDKRLPVTVLRPPHIMGAGRELGTGSVQGRDKNLLRAMRTGQGITLLCEGQLLIQPVWHRQIAEAIVSCAGHVEAFGKAFNIADAETITTRRYYEIIAETLGVPLRFDSYPLEQYRREHPDKRPFARHRVLDLSAIHAATGYRPTALIADAIRETVEWMQEQGMDE